MFETSISKPSFAVFFQSAFLFVCINCNAFSLYYDISFFYDYSLSSCEKYVTLDLRMFPSGHLVPSRLLPCEHVSIKFGENVGQMC